MSTTKTRMVVGASAVVAAVLATLVLLPGTAHAANNSTQVLNSPSHLQVRNSADGSLALLIDLSGCQVPGDRTVNTADAFTWAADANDPAEAFPKAANFVCDSRLQFGTYFADLEIRASSEAATASFNTGTITLSSVLIKVTPDGGSFEGMPASGCQVALSTNLVLQVQNFVHTSDSGWFWKDGWDPTATSTGCWNSNPAQQNWNTFFDFVFGSNGTINAVFASDWT
jgi:hypothetical protein